MNRSVTLRPLALGALLLYMFGGSFLAQAQEKFVYGDFTVAEVAMLPQFCQDRFNNHRNGERWQREFGPENYLHLHHYCAGLVYFNRSSTELDTRSRRYNAQRGIANFDYVLKRWPPGFPLYQLAQMYQQQLQFIQNLR